MSASGPAIVADILGRAKLQVNEETEDDRRDTNGIHEWDSPGQMGPIYR